MPKGVKLCLMLVTLEISKKQQKYIHYQHTILLPSGYFSSGTFFQNAIADN